jgi:hypothetical protein
LLLKYITYKIFPAVLILLTMLGRISFLMAQIRLEHFRLGSKKYTHVSSPVTKLPKAFCCISGIFSTKV